MNMQNKANIYQPIHAEHVGPAPLVIRTIITPSNAMLVGGVPSDPRIAEDYVCVSALPQELQRRIQTAIESIIAAM